MAGLDLFETNKMKKVLVRRAEKELNEDPKQLQAHLTSFRRLIETMPHISCSTDDQFLLAFLRHAKFNHLKAQKRLDNFCTFRTSPSLGCPEWFAECEDDFETYRKMLDMRMSCPIGVLANGTTFVIIKMANFDFSVPFERMVQLNTRMTDYMMFQTGIQIGGYSILLDYTGVTLKQLKVMLSPKESKIQTRYYQEAVPFRIGKVIFYNAPSFFEGIYNLIQHYLNEKVRSRIMVISGSLEAAMNELDGLRKIMPKDYEGEGKTFEEIFDEGRKANEAAFLARKDLKIKVDEDKRQSNSRNLMRSNKNDAGNSKEKSGTFVKLNSGEI